MSAPMPAPFNDVERQVLVERFRAASARNELSSDARSVLMQARLEDLREFDAARAANSGFIQESDSTSKLRLQTLDEFVVQPDHASHLVEKVWPPRAIVVSFGPPKEGKTFSMSDLAMFAAHGAESWHGLQIYRPLRVAFMAGEGTSGLKVRLHAWRQHHDALELKGDLRVLPESLSLPDRSTEALEILKPYKPDVIIIDTLNAFFGGGDENSTADMTRFVSAVRYLRDELDSNISIIHHTGHGNQARERGSIVLRASADVIIQIARDERDASLIGFQVVAGRDVEPMHEPIALRLKRVETDWTDSRGNTLSSCIVEGADDPVSLPGAKATLSNQQRRLYEIAMTMARAKGTGDVLLARMDVSQEAQRQNIAKQTVSSAWVPIANKGYWRLMEPGSVVLKVRP